MGLKFYYKKQEKEKIKKNKIKVALLVDEFFGGAGTAFGGYGFLARHYIAKYIPNDKIQLDCLLCFSKNLEKIREPAQFKPVSFKGQLCTDIFFKVDFRAGPVVKNSPSNAEDAGWGTNVSHTTVGLHGTTKTQHRQKFKNEFLKGYCG